MTDPSERDTLPPLGDDALPRDQERLVMRFATIVARNDEARKGELKKLVNAALTAQKKDLEQVVDTAFEKQRKLIDANHTLIKELLRDMRGDIERQARFDMQLDERIVSLERWRDRDGRHIQETIEALSAKFDEHFKSAEQAKT